MYFEDEKWLNEFKKIAGVIFFERAPLAVDLNEATDLVTKYTGRFTVACRRRNKSYMYNYGDQFTLRAYLESKKPTEFDKIIDGYGDALIYAFDDGHSFVKWNAICLHAFRHHWEGRDDNGLLWEFKLNTDESTGFSAFTIPSFPSIPPILLASSDSFNTSEIAA